MFLKFWDARTARVLFTALVFLLVLAFLSSARETLTLFLFAILFAYLVDPLVSYLEKPLRGRIKAIVAFYFLFVGLLVLLGFLFGPRIVDEGRSLIAGLPALVDRMASGQFIITLGHHQGWDEASEVGIQQFFMKHRNEILNYGEDLVEKLEAPLSHVWWLILIPILGVFFLKNAPSIVRGIVDLGPDRQNRNTIQSIIGDVHKMLGSYIRAQLFLATLTAVTLTIVLSFMRAPYSFILGPLAGACEFLPVVGPAAACTVIFVIAFFAGYSHLLWLFLFLGTWRVIQDYFNAPRIMGRSLGFSPLVEIFGVLAGGEIGGVVGALVAVPVLAILRIFWQRLSSMRRAPPLLRTKKFTITHPADVKD
ncbi:AI-2E family transporter [Tunturiibacter psychrotolerans]|uniref:AI-2E family transporter n=1 Tax=Tunturiibacter psychrotolerans TaxID=3069686 RepID=UPI003D1C6CB2